MATERIVDYDGTFIGGAVSSTDVSTIPMGSYDWSMNMVHRGGVLMVRPGYRCLVTMPVGRLQGAAIFRPKSGLEQMLVAIDGQIWISDYPFNGNYRLMPGVLLSPDAQFVYFQLCEQSVEREEPTLTSAIRFLDAPKNVMIMQDGGRTAPAYYDGFSSGHSRDNEWGVPVGGPMAWVGDRLWVARGSFVYASDIADPLSFREQIYLGGITAFVMPGDVTGMAVTPSLDLQQLLVFTEQTTTLIQANVRTRSSWPAIEGFQTEVYKIGCISHRSIVSHVGQLWWMSPQGVTNVDMATQSKLRSKVPVKDMEMTVSAIGLAGDLSGVAGAAFGSYLLMSVPYEDLYNTHTWVLDNSVADSLSEDMRPTWSGYWTGTRPVAWAYGVVAGQERIYYVSKDHDNQNRLWEAFTPDREDNSCPITWAFATRGYFGPTSGINFPQGRKKRFAFADIAMAEIDGEVDVAVFAASGVRGQFKKVSQKKISVAKGSLSYTDPINYYTQIYGFKPQSRVLRTEDNREMRENTLSTCSVESDELEDREDTFQLVVVGSGHAGVRWIRVHAQPELEDYSGKCEEDETDIRAVRFDGAASKGNDFLTVRSALSAPADYYESTQIVVVEQNGYQETGTGSSTSVISQESADRVARVIATRAAEKNLRYIVPSLISDGTVDS